MVVIMMMVVMMTIDNCSDGDVGSNGGKIVRENKLSAYSSSIQTNFCTEFISFLRLGTQISHDQKNNLFLSCTSSSGPHNHLK